MNIWDGKSAAFLGKTVNCIILNIMWVVFSLPIITVGPATAAMYSVVRKWHLYQEQSVIRCFLHEFRQLFKQGLLGTLWIFLGCLLVIDISFFFHIASSFRVVLLSIAALAFILYSMTSAFLFPLLVHYQLKGLSLIKQAFTFSFLDGKTNFAILLMWVGAASFLFYAPLTLFILIVPVTMITFRFSLFSFEKIKKIQRVQSKYSLLEKVK
ncbi:YesL family protein [Niallia sp. NCCP-28]|uniref:YesL family protein n=1 Tax=Niallia sp. NCCP-28 TaxID=2934712 RepID=UPI00208C16AE|nr:DUF624 domain-containing protein [Niallia sp. NCCP-28]GKU82135.1 hypothetical protein NCCP28_15310 [Niallia sp. NCCP-28]